MQIHILHLLASRPGRCPCAKFYFDLKQTDKIKCPLPGEREINLKPFYYRIVNDTKWLALSSVNRN